ncbi:DUF2399 domain-containing protein [Streptomyces sp. S.PB5]|uniref:DUF2399 domain-containing protein n=1 Tax=Streptomyces sp. S.PB5 TaxID=3020844 RepID=UPI0025AF2DBB|nr:DUF2399 domain-containing protein [Streptomyces sp. S.PB5]MDN3024994.1 DUF2399 domain-containing protein [Streptomyces sp. S.PB5]
MSPAALARGPGWAGLCITAEAVGRHGGHPWRMTAADYTAAHGEGESTPPAAGAVMEERLLSVLLADLTGA